MKIKVVAKQSQLPADARLKITSTERRQCGDKKTHRDHCWAAWIDPTKKGKPTKYRGDGTELPKWAWPNTGDWKWVYCKGVGK